MNILAVFPGRSPLLLICFLLAGFCLQAQDEVRFTAETDRQQVWAGEEFQLVFTLHNAQGRGFQPPSLRDFELLSGPNVSQQTSFVNGDMSSSVSYIFVLSATKPGIYTIGAARIHAKGKIYSSNTRQIEVLAGQSQGNNPVAGAGGELFLVAVASSSKAWIGQQITLDYKLYTRQEAANLRLVSEPKLEGFYVRRQKLSNEQAQIETYKGKPYSVQTIHRLYLYPQKSGSLLIDPLQIQLQGVEKSEDPFFGTVFRKAGATRTLSSAPLRVEARALPEPAPADFSGIIGDYRFSWDAPHRLITTDDAFTLRLSVEGSGDPKLIQAPELQLSPDWEHYDPKVLEQSEGGNDGYINNHSVFEYVAIPSKPMSGTLKPHFSWFNVKSGRYETAGSDLKVEVSQGNGNPTVATQPLKTGEPQVIDDPAGDGSFSWGKWLAYGLLLALALGFILRNRRSKMRRDQKNAARAKRTEAPVQAPKAEAAELQTNAPLVVTASHSDPAAILRLRLQDLAFQAEPEQAAAFFKGLGKWLRQWAESRFGPFADWSGSSLRQALLADPQAAGLADTAMHLYQACEMYQYGSMLPAEPLPELLASAATLLESPGAPDPLSAADQA